MQRLRLKPGPGFPPPFVTHIVERMHNRNIGIGDLNRLRVWIEAKPTGPGGLWYKDVGSFKLCGEGKYPKTFLLPGRLVKGQQL